MQIDSNGLLSMTVSQVEQLGSTSLLHGTVGPDIPFEMVGSGQKQVRGIDMVHLALPPEHLHCFDKDGLRL